MARRVDGTNSGVVTRRMLARWRSPIKKSGREELRAHGVVGAAMDIEDALVWLGLGSDYDARALRQAYRRRALELHPDRHEGSAAAHERFLRLREALDVLREELSRPAGSVVAALAVPCVLMGAHLVAARPLSRRELRRHRQRGGWVSMKLWATRPCPRCQGDGQVVVGRSFFGRPVHTPCPTCDGMGIEGVSRAVRVRLPSQRGSKTVRLRGLGVMLDPSMRSPRGDAVLALHE